MGPPVGIFARQFLRLFHCKSDFRLQKPKRMCPAGAVWTYSGFPSGKYDGVKSSVPVFDVGSMLVLYRHNFPHFWFASEISWTHVTPRARACCKMSTNFELDGICMKPMRVLRELVAKTTHTYYQILPTPYIVQKIGTDHSFQNHLDILCTFNFFDIFEIWHLYY